MRGDVDVHTYIQVKKEARAHSNAFMYRAWRKQKSASAEWFSSKYFFGHKSH